MLYRHLRVLGLLVILTGLSGCLVFTATTALLSTGVAALNDRRHFDIVAVDARIIDSIEEKLNKDNSIEQNAQIQVFSYNQNVLLRGFAPSETLRLRAVELALDTDSVRQVYNQIKIGDKLNDSQRADDMLLSTRIQGTLISVAGIDATHPQVLVSNGHVFLMGLLSREEAAAVVPILQQVEGVRSVSPFVEYVKLLPAE